jgi:hypothetical protein
MPSIRKPRQTASTTRLEALSLERGWSYVRLAEEINSLTGKKISSATVHRIASGSKPSRLTQRIIDDFWAAYDAPVAKRA